MIVKYMLKSKNFNSFRYIPKASFNLFKSILNNYKGKISYPNHLTYIITNSCNCKCVMCNVHKIEKKGELNLEQIKNIFSQLKFLDSVRITGGEPFLRKDLEEVIETISKEVNPVVFLLSSNGILSEKTFQVMDKATLSNRVNLEISLDSIGPEHDRIRGVPNAYKKVIKTLEMLTELGGRKNFSFNVSQVIINEKGFKTFFDLKEILEPMKVDVYPVIAYNAGTALYSGKKIKTNPSDEYIYSKSFKLKLRKFIKQLIRNEFGKDKKIINIIKIYYLLGLYNRILKNVNEPNPKCVALNNHLRLNPNGDIPVCMHNSYTIGNLKKDKFSDLWFSEKTQKHRDWVAKCPGCWVGCEISVNGIYTGDILKTPFLLKKFGFK